MNDLVAASKQYDFLLCSKTMVSEMRLVSELLIPLLRNQYSLIVMPAIKLKRCLKDSLLGDTQSSKWWSTLMSALFGVDMTIPALLKPDGYLTQDPKEKATLFADVLDRKRSNDKLTMPQTCFSEAKLTSLAFRSREIKNLLIDLDANGVLVLMGFFPYF